jgi:hypothetical protein
MSPDFGNCRFDPDFDTVRVSAFSRIMNTIIGCAIGLIFMYVAVLISILPWLLSRSRYSSAPRLNIIHQLETGPNAVVIMVPALPE